MKIKLLREDLLRPLQGVSGVVERRQTLPILGNVRIEAAQDGGIALTTTDLEVEMRAHIEHGGEVAGATTVPARKLLDICRALPEGTEIALRLEEGRMRVLAGNSRFALATLAAEEFPEVGEIEEGVRFTLQQAALGDLFRRTAFAMAQQDVRYYLTGLFIEANAERLRAVATDGHRLALCDAEETPAVNGAQSAILPRKAVLELERLLSQNEETVEVILSSRNARFSLNNLVLTTKLIEGQFPDYDRVIPKKSPNRLLADREPLKEALARVAILANEKFRGVRLETSDKGLKLIAHNPENEEAEETVSARYEGERLVIAFNAGYLQDALGALSSETVEFAFADANSSTLLSAPDVDRCRYVIMPMRL